MTNTGTTKRLELYITLVIVLLSFLIRVIRLDIPHDWSFDEVYHALSAEAYALNDPRGYEWWNPSPKDLAWEWLHPPFGKLMMGLSIKLLAKPYIPESKSAPLAGATTFAWRFPGTIFAALTVWLLIIFGSKLFNNFWIGAVAGGLYGLDGLSFVQSRTGMNDIYIAFFVVLVFYRIFRLVHDYSSSEPKASREVMSSSTPIEDLDSRFSARGGSTFGRRGNDKFKNSQSVSRWTRTLGNLFWLGLASGLAASTKWTGFYAVGIAFVWGILFFAKKRDWKGLFYAIFFLGLIPPLIYVLSYGQWWLQGHTWKQFYELHQQIWWYQTGLKATHGYQSQALTWPFLYRPVWFYVKYQDVIENGQKLLYIGNIYTMGHPFIWWAGLVAIGYGAWQMLLGIWQRIEGGVKKAKDLLPLGILLVGYFSMFLPWTFSPRIMFLYHYLPSVPFLCLLLAYGLNQVRRISRIGRIGVNIYLILVVIGFVYFYPQWAALPLPQKWVDQYYWLPSWK
ncbi:MAG: Glycosyl transferase family 39 [Candidatus Gottesmanbacteria bacterium GW2011_GWB1_43_11]|uniref:Polyprenol-phosphate-mannose--protein mannosyltransferase n=1 Tax=Candidatus Gottesmanbacteria bacterium GW2011_GWB1_43_11 TaxID=1618446 RepID=A0A0G1CH41_9BACT|nr:MAG: Glycosyl transferase family 39 [Candidatus Gottesmanbacteria bacterium GW2011_GWA1_42_26]KKS80867.1 MAG: Glycosyl transferase family 39 [Candidatus Gottesmanbacteria bacterium GW2011_GWC1_43_10]KKS85095.1 MAG: Glycosyl transferase family 39 [Candidatus Gottesmanbacteria bacterium GW2011_GWB1_43_11]OGG07647.1 MAG: hypothetical protein A2699_06150 [Candidatus Gottesmanbacteria bacterium RIFCSPHIGHO2_01_FULL_43_15]OGG28171.1 MAG: hypothetical protein A3A59_04060 [Candidatus Gottesmanbacter